MTAPRLEIHLDRVKHNTRNLVERLARVGISVTGVTKATMGSPEIARALMRAGVTGLGESRIENVATLRAGGVTAPITLIRSPMISQVDRVVELADVSLNTELDVIARLSAAAVEQRTTHDVVLMVELGDLREGILPGDVEAVARRTAEFPGIRLRGLGTNLACQSGVVPDGDTMAALSRLADRLETALDTTFAVVSGGNSANLSWALGDPHVGRVNDLRLGESILLGREPLRRTPVDGLRTDAFVLVGEVIEAKTKPSQPWGRIEQTAFGEQAPADDRGDHERVIVALGRQDADPDGLTPPAGYRILGASSDHLVLEADGVAPRIGTELSFQLDYSALLRAMTSPFVTRHFAEGDLAVGSGHTPAVVVRSGRP